MRNANRMELSDMEAEGERINAAKKERDAHYNETRKDFYMSKKDYEALEKMGNWAKENPDKIRNIYGVEDESSVLGRVDEWSKAVPFDAAPFKLEQLQKESGVKLDPKTVEGLIKSRKLGPEIMSSFAKAAHKGMKFGDKEKFSGGFMEPLVQERNGKTKYASKGKGGELVYSYDPNERGGLDIEESVGQEGMGGQDTSMGVGPAGASPVATMNLKFKLGQGKSQTGIKAPDENLGYEEQNIGERPFGVQDTAVDSSPRMSKLRNKINRNPAKAMPNDVGASADPEADPNVPGMVLGPYDSDKGGIPASPVGTLGAREKAAAIKKKRVR